jgi:hypothetical protein
VADRGAGGGRRPEAAVGWRLLLSSFLSLPHSALGWPMDALGSNFGGLEGGGSGRGWRNLAKSSPAAILHRRRCLCNPSIHTQAHVTDP